MWIFKCHSLSLLPVHKGSLSVMAPDVRLCPPLMMTLQLLNGYLMQWSRETMYINYASVHLGMMNSHLMVVSPEARH